MRSLMLHLTEDQIYAMDCYIKKFIESWVRSNQTMDFWNPKILERPTTCEISREIRDEPALLD